MPASNENTCTTREAAQLLGISLRTAQLWVEDGRLSAWKTPGGHRRICRRSIEAMLEQRVRAMHHKVAGFDILIVEDDPVIREIYASKLSSLGNDVQLRFAPEGYSGLIALGERPPQLLISDLMMPGIDGFQMLRSLEGNPRLAATGIVVVTSLSEEDIAERGGLPNGVAILHKPLQAARLIKLVQAHRAIHQEKYQPLP